MEENKEENIDLGKKLEEEFAKIKNTVRKPNILIAGATGVGKSSIINYIFGKDFATVGTGKPVTQQIDVFESEDVDVRLYDSKGYEVKNGGDEEFFKNVVDLPKLTGKPEDAVHLIWYCIAASSSRVTEYDLNAIKKFSESNVPVSVLLTKTDISTDEDVEALKKVIKDSFPEMSVFETSVLMEEYNHIESLIEWSVNNLAQPLRYAFIKSQKASLKEKWNKAHLMIAEHTTGAFAVGFTPIPMSDAPILVANEIGLLARILYLYNLGSLSDTLKTAGLGAIIGSLLSSAGKAAVGAIVKLIPGVGTVVGGLISGGVGAAITFAFGEATSGCGYKINAAMLNGNEERVKELVGSLGKTILDTATKFMQSGKKSKDDYKLEDLDLK